MQMRKKTFMMERKAMKGFILRHKETSQYNNQDNMYIPLETERRALLYYQLGEVLHADVEHLGDHHGKLLRRLHDLLLEHRTYVTVSAGLVRPEVIWVNKRKRISLHDNVKYRSLPKDMRVEKYQFKSKH